MNSAKLKAYGQTLSSPATGSGLASHLQIQTSACDTVGHLISSLTATGVSQRKLLFYKTGLRSRWEQQNCMSPVAKTVSVFGV